MTWAHRTGNLEFKKKPGLFAAGQLSGIEGYAGNISSGLIAGINASWFIRGLESLECPKTTMTRALIHYVTQKEVEDVQSMKVMFGLLPYPEDDL